MKNLTNKLFTNVANFAEAPSAIANAADKLLSLIFAEENVAARDYEHCSYCVGLGQHKVKKCQKCSERNGKDMCEGWRVVPCSYKPM